MENPSFTQSQLAEINSQIATLTENSPERLNENFSLPLANVPLSMITFEKNLSLRNKVDTKSQSYQELKTSIKSNGLMQPPILRRHPNGGFVVIDGFHRWTACNELGINNIPAIFRPNITEDLIIKLQFTANAARVETKRYQYAKHIERLAANHPDWNQTQIAEFLGITQSEVSKFTKAALLPEHIGAMVDSGDITMASALSLVTLIPFEENLDDWVNRAKSMTAVEFATAVNARQKILRNQGRGTPEVWAPSPSLRKAPEIKNMFDEIGNEVSNINLNNVNTTTSDYKAGFYAAIAWAVRMDVQSIEDQRTKHAEVEAERAAKPKAQVSNQASKSLLGAMGLKAVIV